MPRSTSPAPGHASTRPTPAPAPAPAPPERGTTARRLALVTGVGVLTALAARRAQASSPSSDLEIGGSTGAQDVHLSCGPDVRVAHASGGAHYEHVFQAEGEREGVGMLVDVRAGVGTTTIESVSGGASQIQALQPEIDRRHVLSSTQGTFGFDWYSFALTGGVGYYGISEVVDGSKFRAHYLPLPALDMRIGRRTGFSGDVGLGAPPIAGLARWYSLYGIAQYRFQEGGEVGAGLVSVFGELDTRTGVVVKGAVPVTPWLSVGGFGMVGSDSQGTPHALDWTAGASVNVKIDDPE